MLKKVLIIDNSKGVTGAFKAIETTALSLRSEFEFHFAVPIDSSIGSQLERQHFPVMRLPFLEIRKSWRSVFYPLRLSMNARKVLGYCRAHSISIIHVNDLYNMVGVACRSMDSSLRLVQHVRLLPGSYARPLYGFWLKQISRKASTVVAVSEAVKNSIVSKVKDDRLIRIYDFFPLKEIVVGRPRDSSAVAFLYLANFTPGKGHLYAVQALNHVRKINANVKLTLAGSDFGLPANMRYKQQVIQQIREYGLEDIVAWGMPEWNIEELIKSHQVVLNFSDSESFSMVCYEALCYQTPVITTDCGGPAELITHRVTGMLVPVGDVDAMASAMLDLATDAEFRSRLAQRGYEEIRQRIQVENSPEQFKKLYESLLEA